jgi:large subunit ribosomal protein L15
MPLTRRLPKRGFTNVFRKSYACINVGTLEARFEGGTAVTPQTLLERGLIGALRDGVKVLGEGTLTKALTVQAHRFSRSAAEKIAAAGGRAVVIGA